MTTTVTTPDMEQPGYLLDWELKPSTERVIISGADQPGRVLGFHRELCTYWNQPVHVPTYEPALVDLVFEAERERNRTGGPRTAYFCPRCMVRRIR